MTREEALEVLFKRSPEIVRIVNKIMAWDPDMSTAENARALGMAQASAAHFKVRWGLVCNDARLRPKSPHIGELNRIVELKNSGKTYAQIGAIIGCRTSVVWGLLKRHCEETND